MSMSRNREFMNLVASKQRVNAQWFSIRNEASGSVQVSIFDEIGFWGVSATDFCDQLAQSEGPVDLYLNSPGGEIFDGLTIYNALLRRDVSVYVEGIAASAASFIAQAAAPGKLGMAKTASMMIHNGMSFAAGDAAELRKAADIIEAQTLNIAEIYAERSGRPLDELLEMMDTETWLRSADTVSKGLADYVYDPRTGPSNVLARRPEPGTQPPAVIANEDSVDHSAWDAAKAWANGADSDDPEAFYRGICAGEHTSGDPGTQAHWALPYRYTPSSAPNAAGVANALSRLPQTEDLKDPAGVKAKLQKLMKQVNPDYEPEDRADFTHFEALMASDDGFAGMERAFKEALG